MAENYQMSTWGMTDRNVNGPVIVVQGGISAGRVYVASQRAKPQAGGKTLLDRAE